MHLYYVDWDPETGELLRCDRTDFIGNKRTALA